MRVMMASCPGGGGRRRRRISAVMSLYGGGIVSIYGINRLIRLHFCTFALYLEVTSRRPSASIAADKRYPEIEAEAAAEWRRKEARERSTLSRLRAICPLAALCRLIRVPQQKMAFLCRGRRIYRDVIRLRMINPSPPPTHSTSFYTMNAGDLYMAAIVRNAGPPAQPFQNNTRHPSPANRKHQFIHF